jgi:hypothetical protein
VFLDHPLLLAVCLFLFLMSVVETGFRLAVLTGANLDDDSREPIAASRDSLGILLSFMLGFTLAMALPRFDLRKHLVMEEANAIGTTSLRAGLGPEPQRSQVRALLLQYVQVRQAYSQAGPRRTGIDNNDRSQALQSSWRQKTEEAARQSPTLDTIDLSEKRLTALENRIPATIWLKPLLIALMTCSTFGYWQRKRFWLVAVASPLMIAIVMGLIANLENSRSGFLRVDLRSLERLDLRSLPLASPNTL